MTADIVAYLVASILVVVLIIVVVQVRERGIRAHGAAVTKLEAKFLIIITFFNILVKSNKGPMVHNMFNDKIVRLVNP